jgi:hypothetical protein
MNTVQVPPSLDSVAWGRANGAGSAHPTYVTDAPADNLAGDGGIDPALSDPKALIV